MNCPSKEKPPCPIGAMEGFSFLRRLLEYHKPLVLSNWFIVVLDLPPVKSGTLRVAAGEGGLNSVRKHPSPSLDS